MIEVDIAALAKLARLEVAQDEMQRLQKEIPPILAFVETIQKAATHDEEKGGELRNVMREDTDPHEGGLYTKDILDAAPAQRDGRVVVKQVISRKK